MQVNLIDRWAHNNFWSSYYIHIENRAVSFIWLAKQLEPVGDQPKLRFIIGKFSYVKAIMPFISAGVQRQPQSISSDAQERASLAVIPNSGMSASE